MYIPGLKVAPMPAAASISHFPVLDREAARTFLEYLDPDTDEFTFQTFTDSEERRKTYTKNERTRLTIDPLAKVLHGTLDEHWATFVDLCRQGAAVFVTVNRTTLCGRRNRENITGIRAYFLDCDSVQSESLKASLTAFGLMPHIILRSSEGKYQVYWCVIDAPLSGFGDTQKKLSEAFGSDPSVCDLPRVMRLPGFPHQKDGSKGELVKLLSTFDGPDYRDVQFQHALANALASFRLPKSLTDTIARNLGPLSPDWAQGYSEGQRNNECARRAGLAISAGLPQERVLEKCLAWNELNNPPLSEAEVRTVVGSIWKTHTKKQAMTVGVDGVLANHVAQDVNLPTIQVVGGGLSNEATAGEEAIIRAGHPVYHRGTTLVRPIIAEVEATHERRTKVPQLAPITQPYMVDLLCRSAKWMRYDGRRKEDVPIDPPEDIARVILHRAGEWNFNPVIGVITTPTLRRDGSLLTQPGYDLATRMVLVEPPLMPAISAHPTSDEAIAALNLLDGLLEEFPIVDEASRSVALSCLLTPVVRGAFPVAPMHASCAPAAGTGKSFLFDVSAAIAIGQPCPVMAAGRTEEETEKRLGAALIAGQPIINIDNVNGELGGDALCQIVERPLVEIRVLGKSERVRVESRCTVFANGNNLRLLGDMTRRVVRCMLDARRERPELRQFRRDPVGEVLTDRGRYIAAVLTVVRAYVVAGRPQVAPRLPSFQGWSDMVRSPLIWLGRADPIETMESARRDDPSLQAMEAVFAALKEAIGVGLKISVAEIIAHANEMTVAIFPKLSELKHPELKEALQTVAGDRNGVINSRTLGRWLSRHKGRIAKGVRLEGEADEHGHPVRWRLINCG
jgi:putative DNA primase/helicase